MAVLKGQAAIVTGAGRGIGRAIAIGLAREGANVTLTDLSRDSIESVAAEIRAMGCEALTIEGDISKVDTIKHIFDTHMETFEDLDILVNVAGMQTTTACIDYTEENWDRQMNVNLRAVFFCCQAAARIMQLKKNGKIVNISSTSGFVSSTNPKAAYDVSKAGVIHMTVSLGKELSKFGINVNSVAPGTITTEMTKAWLENPEGLEKSLSRIPLGRIGDVEDVVGPVVFLCSPAASYIVGHTLVVDGGWLL
ncbi:SDR family NAD(P)-dependent oxidoreductase [Pseudomonas azerbaijanoccidentalis]|jgi:2-deoxy-D-gluconate 3-dehydrogenase